MVNLNFTEAKKAELLPEGVYLVKIEEAKEAVSSKGNQMIKIRFREPESNSVIFDNLTLTPAAMWKVAEFFEALGYDVKQDLDDFEPALIVGEEMNIKIIQETGNDDVVRNKATKYMKA